jgi:Cys-tRNA(Pro)/Cys-tRNA(Cys) deacylase
VDTIQRERNGENRAQKVIAAKRDFPVYVDETIDLFDVVSISAGVRGLQILVAPADYLRASKGMIAALGQPKAG